MSRYNPYYYLLFVLLIFGAFASMAQNDYGIKILGGAAFVFGLLFLLQLLGELRSKHKTDVVAVAELFGLTVIAIILSMRVFYIRFPFVEIVFGFAGLVLLAAYSLRLFRTWRNLQTKSRAMAILLVMFHGSILCYVASGSSHEWPCLYVLPHQNYPGGVHSWETRSQHLFPAKESPRLIR